MFEHALSGLVAPIDHGARGPRPRAHHAVTTPRPRRWSTVRRAAADRGLPGPPVEEQPVNPDHPSPASSGPHRGTRPGHRLGDAALRAAAAGWAVFPVRPAAKVPAITDWENAATTDAGQIREWWTARAWNIGLATGPSGLLVIDLDLPADLRPASGPVGSLRTLEELSAAQGQPPPTGTYSVRTPSGGMHLYFRQPTGAALRSTQGALGELIDTRGHGGYVLAAGSTHTSGRTYDVTVREPVALLPAWLDQALAPPPQVSPPTARRTAPAAGGRREQAYLRAVVDGECEAVVAAVVGQRHRTLLRAARRLGHWVGGGALTEVEARSALSVAAAGYIGVAGYTARQVRRDISDGIVYGARRGPSRRW
jgi:hypothetical protein